MPNTRNLVKSKQNNKPIFFRETKVSTLVRKVSEQVLKRFASFDKDEIPKNKILIGTHHKTGTVWLESVFSKVSNQFDLEWFSGGNKDVIPKEWQVLQHTHSHFQKEILENNNFKGLHIIRDPRDIAVSAAFYHCKSHEDWLHVPRAEFGNKTYQNRINECNNFDDKLIFEMDHSTATGLSDISQWNYDDLRFINVKYEELIADNNMKLFRDVFEFLGFKGEALIRCLQIAFANSLFSGRVTSQHVRSGNSNQWKEYFKKSHAEHFCDKFGDLLIRLGYEENNNWVKECKDH